MSFEEWDPVLGEWAPRSVIEEVYWLLIRLPFRFVVRFAAFLGGGVERTGWQYSDTWRTLSGHMGITSLKLTRVI